MKTVAIGEAGEYGSRLVSFLENHLSREIHLVRCTEVDQFEKQVPKDAYCIVSKEFAEVVEKGYSAHILIGEQEDTDTFCRYHSPVELVEYVEAYFSKVSRDESIKQNKTATLIAIYTPVYLSGMREIARRYMDSGGLCIGMEDLGEGDRDSPNMGDLCYYIRLRKNDITGQLQQMMQLQQERYYINSPDLYYDLADLNQEDFSWFFDQIKNMSGYRNICVLLGSTAVRTMDIFQNFDQIVMVGKRNHRKLNLFWKRFQQALEDSSIQPPGGTSMVYQEEVW